MPKIIIDGQEIQARKGVPVLVAALEAGMDIPYYCYHPGLKIVASCRLCLMEMKMPHPKTQEPVWAPKLFPACQTPVRVGMEVRFNSEKVLQNQQHVLEYYLLDHPLDCPVCDKAGECSLQDFTERHGPASSRMVENKHKNAKKDIGPHTLLYSDRCIVCTRCVRFTQEISGTGELAVINRGSRNETDIFPGRALDNPLQGNVVDLCPVGALIDKGFQFKQRVWLLESTRSISPADSRGQAIFIDHNEHGIHRIRARYNEKVNEWWISDEARFDWHYVQREDRLSRPRVRGDDGLVPVRWEELPKILHERLRNALGAGGGAALALVLSPMMSCEEAWLLATHIRELAPEATLVTGYVPTHGEDQTFPRGFVIKAEKCPNRRGVETVIERLGGSTLTWGDFLGQAAAGKFKAACVVGGYPEEWVVTREVTTALAKVDCLVVHDLFPSALDELATIQIPGVSWAEREGSFMNCDGLIQPFERALPPREGVKPDGQLFYELAGHRGLFRAAKVREMMTTDLPQFAEVFVPQDLPRHFH